MLVIFCKVGKIEIMNKGSWEAVGGSCVVERRVLEVCFFFLGIIGFLFFFIVRLVFYMGLVLNVCKINK